ncbi:MAG: flagellar biosynthetic protein FliR [Pseudomonadota bacterium]
MTAAIDALLSVAPGYVLLAAAVVTRIGAALLLVPGLGERGVPMRIKLGVTLALTALVLPLLADRATAEAMPVGRPEALALLLLSEAATGLALGFAFRTLVFTLQIAGTVAAQNITISHIFGNGLAPEAEPTLASFLAMGGIAILMVGGLHVELVLALSRLYALLPPGAVFATDRLADWSVRRTAELFALGISLAMPFVLVGFAYNLALGALSRAMPQLLVALVGVPLLVGLGIGTLWLVLPELFSRWIDVASGLLADPLGRLL